MAVVPAEIEDRATLVEQLIEWNAFARKIALNRGSCFAEVVLGSHGTFGDRVEVIRDEFCGLRSELVECCLVNVERNHGLQSTKH